MFIYRLAVPIDDFDGLTPLPEWLAGGDAERTLWMLVTTLALADAAAQVGWRGDMRHLPSVGVSPEGELFLVIKQVDNGATFVITLDQTPSLAELSTVHTTVPAHEIGLWTHPTADDTPDMAWLAELNTDAPLPADSDAF